jgi:hypothetical protein
MPPTLEITLSREFQACLDVIIQTTTRFWEYKPHHHFSNQGARHSERVHRIAIDIACQLPEDCRLSQAEFFILSAASWLYEVGMQPRSTQPVLGFDWRYGEYLTTAQLLKIRANRHLVTEGMLLESVQPPSSSLHFGLGLPVNDFTRAVIVLCRWCSNDPLTSVPESLPAHGETIRIRLLTAILRLADQLYIDGSRVDIRLLQRFNLPPHEFLRWAVFPLVENQSIENNKIRFFYNLPPSLQGFIGSIRGVVEQSFDPMKHALLKFLWDQRLYLRLHDTPILLVNQFTPLSLEFEAALITALQRMPRMNLTSVEVGGEIARTESKPTDSSSLVDPASQLDLHVQFLSHSFPTSYCRHLDATSFPFITVYGGSTSPESQSRLLHISAYIEDYSDQTVTTSLISSNTSNRIALLPLLKPSKLSELTDARRATLRVTITELGTRGAILYDHTETITLLAKNTAVLALIKPNQEILDLTDYLAAWVTPYASEIDRYLRKAVEYHPQRQFIGYGGGRSAQKTKEILRTQTKAIFTMLKQDVSLSYINTTMSFGAESDQITQRIRLPSQSINAGGAANCIDGAVLFASFLEAASIQPLLVLIPGHAFVGWRIWEDEFEFLETTMIGSSDYESAVASAKNSYERASSQGFFNRGLYDQEGFGRIIDIVKCRRRNIFSIE